jgi:hypothetical protein
LTLPPRAGRGESPPARARGGKPPPRRLASRAVSFDVGECLGLGFAAWARNLLTFAVVATVVQLPLIVYTALLLAKGMPDGPEGRENFEGAWDTWDRVKPLGSALLSLVATGAMTYGVVQHLRRTPASLGDCLGVGLSRLPAVVLVSLCLLLCVALASLPFFVALAVVRGGGLLLALPLLALPVYAFCMLWPAVPVAVVERAGIGGALARSAALTRGSRGAVFVVLLVLFLLQVGVTYLLRRGFFADLTWDSFRTYLLLEFLVVVLLLGSLQSTVNAVGYWLLRSRKEGASIEDLAKVFE